MQTTEAQSSDLAGGEGVQQWLDCVQQRIWGHGAPLWKQTPGLLGSGSDQAGFNKDTDLRICNILYH